jgi:hypothetical protein
MENKQTLPNSTATLVLGICSLVFSFFLFGFILGIIGLGISSKSKRLYLQSPNDYSGYRALNAGRVMSLISVILGAILILYMLIAEVFDYSFFGFLK